MLHAYFLIYPLAGVVTGMMAGLLGLGGGIIVVPLLATLFPLLGIDPALSVHLAVGTSTATIIATATVSTRAHFKRRNTNTLWHLGWKLWPGIIIGAILGAVIAAHLSSKHLSLLFGFIVLLLAIRVIFIRNQVDESANEIENWQIPPQFFLTLITMIIGGLSSLLGMGGGVFMVPLLQQFRLPIRYAVAMSAACGLPIAVVGTLSYMIMGYHETLNLSGSTGYVYWPAFIGIIITSMIFAPLGVKLAHRLPVRALRLIFIIYLLVVGLKMIIF